MNEQDLKKLQDQSLLVRLTNKEHLFRQLSEQLLIEEIYDKETRIIVRALQTLGEAIIAQQEKDPFSEIERAYELSTKMNLDAQEREEHNSKAFNAALDKMVELRRKNLEMQLDVLNVKNHPTELPSKVALAVAE